MYLYLQSRGCGSAPEVKSPLPDSTEEPQFRALHQKHEVFLCVFKRGREVLILFRRKRIPAPERLRWVKVCYCFLLAFCYYDGWSLYNLWSFTDEEYSRSHHFQSSIIKETLLTNFLAFSNISWSRRSVYVWIAEYRAIWLSLFASSKYLTYSSSKILWDWFNISKYNS